jgi:hypothetical protein
MVWLKVCFELYLLGVHQLFYFYPLTLKTRQKTQQFQQRFIFPSYRPTNTVKASTFEPHENWTIFKRLSIIKTVLEKNQENECWRKTSDLQTRFCSYLIHDSPKEATDLARKGSKFP